MTNAARVAADIAAVLPTDDPLAQLARLRLDAEARAQEGPVMHRITTPNDAAVQHIGDPVEPATCWLIHGVGYSDSAAVIAYADRTDGVTADPVDDVPAGYLDQVRQVRAGTLIHVGTPAVDGEDRSSRHRWPDMDGSPERRDMRAELGAVPA